MTEPHGSYVGSPSPRSVRMTIKAGYSYKAMENQPSAGAVKGVLECGLLGFDFPGRSVEWSEAIEVLIHIDGIAGIPKLEVITLTVL